MRRMNRAKVTATCGLMLAAVLAMAVPSALGQKAHWTQYHINEIAASCVTAEMAFHDYRGSPRPGESPAAFARRIQGYIGALDRLIVNIAPLRDPPSPADGSTANLRRWKEIEQSTTRLPDVTAALKSAWKAHGQRGAQAQVPRRLADCVVTLEDLLNDLRDARP